jgi:aspartate kinase
MQTLVMKFGGTSVGNAGAIQQTAAICVEQKKSSENLVVVVSAMSGITDLLIKAAQQAAANQTEEMLETIELIRSKHLQAIRDLIPAETPRVAERESVLAAINSRLNDLANYCHSIQVLGEVTSRGMDVISSLGERMSAQILAALLRVMGTPALAVEATELIVTDRSFQSANPQMAASREKSRKVLLPLFHQGFVPVVTGFMAATPEGIITTLGRGGSDYTGAILADCLDVERRGRHLDRRSARGGACPHDPRDFFCQSERAGLFWRQGSAPQDHPAGYCPQHATLGEEYLQPNFPRHAHQPICRRFAS